MDNDSTNEGSFDVIRVIGRAQNQPKEEGRQQPQARKADEDESLEELQQRYLWLHTFREI